MGPSRERLGSAALALGAPRSVLGASLERLGSVMGVPRLLGGSPEGPRKLVSGLGTLVSGLGELVSGPGLCSSLAHELCEVVTLTCPRQPLEVPQAPWRNSFGATQVFGEQVGRC